MKQKTNGLYNKIKLSDVTGIIKMCMVHRLVAYVFIPNDDPINKTFVNHIDEIKKNNYFQNLEWITPQQNTVYSIGVRISMVDKNDGTVLKKFECMSDACRYLGKNPSAGTVLKKCCEDIRRTAYGYCWLAE
jgi:hypothetical protein